MEETATLKKMLHGIHVHESSEKTTKSFHQENDGGSSMESVMMA